jgi:hypothetical protein
MSISTFPTAGTVGANLKPKRYDLEIYQGDTFRFNVVLSGDTGPLDITGWTASASIKDKKDGNAPTPELDITVGDTDGTIEVFLSNTGTDALVAADGPYKYDIQLTDTAGNVRTFLAGFINVTEDITP